MAGNTVVVKPPPSCPLANVTLELGGNDAVLILEDAEFTEANMDALFGGIYASTGQICMNAKRIYVHSSKKDELVAALTQRLENVKIVPASDPSTTMGPFHQEAQLRFVTELVQEARDSGADVREFGELPGGEWSEGHFMRPSMIIDPAQDLRVDTEEQFGPTIPIITFEDVEEGFRMVNDTEYGLCNSVWTADEETARAVGSRLQSGYVFHNTHGAPFLDQRAPFGGIKQSGIGREMGPIGLRAFMEPHALGLSKD